MRIRCVHTINDLADDLRAMPAKARTGMVETVRSNVNEGHRLAQQFAREKSGPHGKAYYKRITSEMIGPLSGEYGPHDGGIPVGGGWRHGPPNMDLARSTDIIGPEFASDVRKLLDRLFW